MSKPMPSETARKLTDGIYKQFDYGTILTSIEDAVRTAWLEGYELAKSEPIFAVVCGNYHPREMDSLWHKQSEAQTRADELGGMWEVEEITVSRGDSD